MAKYYRVVEDLEVGDLLELNAEGKIQLHVHGNLFGAARADVAAGKKISMADIEPVKWEDTEELEVPVMEIVHLHDHDGDGEADHEAEDCSVVEVEVIEADPVPELQLEEVQFEEPEEKKPWWWKS